MNNNAITLATTSSETGIVLQRGLFRLGRMLWQKSEAVLESLLNSPSLLSGVTF